MEGEKTTSIEMQPSKNIYPVISGEISEQNSQAQPCDTQPTSSSYDIDEAYSDNEMLRAQPLKVFYNVYQATWLR